MKVSMTMMWKFLLKLLQYGFSIESHYNGILEHPQYTRPEEWRGRRVPEVLISGHHANIKKWQEEMAVKVTERKRPDLLEEKPTK